MNTLPEARTHRLVVEELLSEVLIYDLDRNKAHCLNESAALVWKNCNGRTTVKELAGLLGVSLGAYCDEDMVRIALDQLGKKHLLKTEGAPAQEMAGFTRRRMMRNLGIAAAVSVPVITSLVAPTAVQAATCLPQGSPCTMDGDCCSQNCNIGMCGPIL